MAEIKTVTIDELCQMNDQEGLILQGCGGDLQEWVDGINELLTQGGILQAGSGTTVLAAVLEGYTATGIEVTDEYARRARERIAKEVGVYEDLSGVAS